MMTETAPMVIVLVEDDPGHARLAEKNLHRSRISNEIVILNNGQKALDYLFREGDYREQGSLPPVLILLDLNMPVLDGYEVLRRVKSDERTRHIPVIVISSNDDPNEIARCYALGGDIFITKPVEHEKFWDAIRRLDLSSSIVLISEGS